MKITAALLDRVALFWMYDTPFPGVDIPAGSEPDPASIAILVKIRETLHPVCRLVLKGRAYDAFFAEARSFGDTCSAACSPAREAYDVASRRAMRLPGADRERALVEADVVFEAAVAPHRDAALTAIATIAWRYLADPNNLCKAYR